MQFKDMKLLIDAYQQWNFEKADLKKVTKQFLLEDNETLHGEKKSYWKMIEEILRSPKYELVHYVVSVINLMSIVVLIMGESQENYNKNKYWIIQQLVISSWLLAELLVNFKVLGIVKIIKIRPFQGLEIFSQILSQYAYASWFWNGMHQYEVMRYLQLVIFLRLLKNIMLLYELQTTRVIMQSMKHLIKPMLNLLGVLFTIFYIFGLLFVLTFGGKVERDGKWSKSSKIPP